MTKRISISKAICLAALLLAGSTGIAFGQKSITVRGKVVDASASSSPLPGVTVLASGLNISAVSDSEGNYVIDVPSPETVLEFSIIGYKTVKERVGIRNEVNVNMEEDILMLDAVVAVGYGTMKKSDITGSVASVDADLMENKPVSSFDNALRGQIAGVVVNQNDGQPGGGSSVRIRGTSSINGTNEPLYVIDGVPLISESVTDGYGVVINPLANVNVNDIESIEVLKDASAAAIYGARGANGVVLVTTKKGSEGGGEVSFSSTLTLSSPYNAYKMLDGPQLAQLGKEAYENAFLAVPSYFQDPSSAVTRTDWVGEMLRNAVTQNYQLNFSGGSQKVKYNFSAGYFDQDGVIITTNYKRYSFRGNVAADVNKYVSFGSTVSYTKSRSAGYGHTAVYLDLLSMAYDMNPALPVREADGSYLYRNNLSSSTGNVGGNPVATAYGADMLNAQNRITGNLFGELKLMNGMLVFRSQINLDDIFSSDRSFIPNDLVASVDGPGKADISQFATATWGLDNTLTYKNEWNRHALTAMVGQTSQKFTQNITRIGVKDFEDNRLGYHDISSGKNVWNVQSPDSEWTMLSYIGRLHYSFDNRYLFTFTGRVDGSSKFGANNKYGFFPSGALAWRISEEEFMSDVRQISNLKLRVSYGLVGNAGIAPYQSQGTLVTVAPQFGGNVPNSGLAPMTIPNADLSWESTSQFDMGVDMGLFNGRMNLTADYYRKYTTDLLYNVDVPAYSGYLFSLRNLGDLSNTGWEVTLGGYPLDGQKFKWFSSMNISGNVTRVEKLNVAEGESAGTDVLRLVSGGRLGDIYGYRTNGIAQLDEDLTQVAQLPNRPLTAGEQKYKDITPDGIIDIHDQVVLGNINPLFTFGFTNNFEYRNFTLGLFIEGAYGNDIINYTRKGLESLDGSRNNITTTLDRWTPENTKASLPRADANSNSGAFSDRWVEDGSYVRLKDLTLGYNIPGKALKDIAAVNVFMSFENLVTLTGYSGNDPAIGGGIDNNLYPTARKSSFGIKLTF